MINLHLVILKIILKGQRTSIFKNNRTSHNALYILQLRLGLFQDGDYAITMDCASLQIWWFHWETIVF